MVTTTGYDSEKQAFAALSTLLIPAFDNETPKLNRIDRWWRWNPKPIRLNVGATPEHRMLRDMGETPWLGLVVTTLAQTLYLEGVDSETQDTVDAQRFWEPWQRNRMGERQIALHREAIAYGTAYTAVQGEDTPDGLHARIDCWSPRDAIALYDDPASDNWPQIFMRRRKLGDKTIEYQLWDAWSIWTWRRTGGTWAFDGQTPHGVASPDGDPVCPIVRYCNQRDLQGRVPGEIEPYIRMASRLNKDNYDRMLAQHYNSWKVKTATGLDMSGLTEAEKEAKKLQIEHDSVLAGGMDVKFGSLPETDLANIVAAKTSDVEELAAVSQTPTTAFGKMTNVGDAGIEESRAGFYAKRNERRRAFGVSHMDTLRLASSAEGRQDDAANFHLFPKWEDTDTRTLSQAVDALGKAVQMLHVPNQLVWDMIPGISKPQADAWREYAAQHPSADDIAAQIQIGQLNGNGAYDDGIDG